MDITQLLILILVFAIVGVLAWQLIRKAKNKTLTEKDIEIFKNWLVYACALAQKEIGKDTGVLKLYYVYNMAVEKFPAIAAFISFKTFSSWVVNAKEELLNMCKDNEKIKQFLYGLVGEAEQQLNAGE